MGLFRLLARTTIGLLFVGHGTQKLFGWFGGGGLEGTAGFFEQLGFRPGRRYALAAGAAEAGGGLLFALGAATPLGAAAVSGSIFTAIKTVHWEKGVWVSAVPFDFLQQARRTGAARPRADVDTRRSSFGQDEVRGLFEAAPAALLRV